ncbi:F-box protein [Sesbania bispinosa]|nr:F-box protein [Sesbania bispinosa]
MEKNDWNKRRTTNMKLRMTRTRLCRNRDTVVEDDAWKRDNWRYRNRGRHEEKRRDSAEQQLHWMSDARNRDDAKDDQRRATTVGGVADEQAKDKGGWPGYCVHSLTF